jgi:hypothetical protein
MIFILICLTFLISDDAFELGILRFEIFFCLLFLFNNLAETEAENLFATIYKNPKSQIVNSSFIITTLTTLGEIVFTLIIWIIGSSLENSWNVYIGSIIACNMFLLFCFMYKYQYMKTSFR